MSPERKKAFLFYLCLVVGSTDVVVGLLLMVFPAFTLKLMWVPPVVPDALVFIRFIGAFVFGVGCIYFSALLSVLFAIGRDRSIRSIVLATAWMRLVICFFTMLALLSGQLEAAWISVPLFDGLLGSSQIWLVLHWDC